MILDVKLNNNSVCYSNVFLTINQIMEGFRDLPPGKQAAFITDLIDYISQSPNHYKEVLNSDWAMHSSTDWKLAKIKLLNMLKEDMQMTIDITDQNLAVIDKAVSIYKKAMNTEPYLLINQKTYNTITLSDSSFDSKYYVIIDNRQSDNEIELR